MHVDQRRELIRLEQEANALYAFVEVSAPSGEPAWKHVDSLHHRGYLPDLTCWCFMCTRALRGGVGLEQVRELRGLVPDLLRRGNIEYDYARHA